MSLAKREIDDFALDVKARERREAAAVAKSPEELFYIRQYPGKTFPIKGNRRLLLEVTRYEGDVMFAALRGVNGGGLGSELRMSQDLFLRDDLQSPHPLTGGVGEATDTMRKLPNVKLTKAKRGYARQISQGWDSWQESFELVPSQKTVERLERAKAMALETSDQSKSVVPFDLDGCAMMAHAYASKGSSWLLSCDDFLFMIGSPKKNWSVSVRYLSAGIWEHGLAALQDRVRAILWGGDAFEGNKTDEPDYATGRSSGVRVTRADYCFDFHSPDFKQEFRPRLQENIVAHSSVKSHAHCDLWENGGRGETLNIGKINNLQVAIYDKTKEIREASGKEWMVDLWLAGTDGEWIWDEKPDNVWRLEIRLGKEFLKNRNIRDCGQVLKHRDELLTEALYTRRLTRPSRTDQDRKRWPLHPIWSLAVEAIDAGAMVPLGRKVTGRRDALLEASRKQINGTLRSMAVLQSGEANPDDLHDFLVNTVDEILEDPEHDRKVLAARFRYENVDEAR